MNLDLLYNNPLEINIPEKNNNLDDYDINNYIYIQKQLNDINIDSLLQNLYETSINNRFYTFNDFKNRCTRGISQKIIDFDNNILPSKNLYKIGNGGNKNNCIICCTSISHNRDTDAQKDSRFKASQLIKESLEEVGYNGYFYLLNGGFPNPTGIELKYMGVPYCFKIFMMLEAKKLGFKNIIWIDSGCVAINNPDVLFNLLEENGTLIDYIGSNNNYNEMVFKNTIDLLNSITKTDIHTAKYIPTIVFGFNLESKNIQKIIDEYYHMVKLGLPFMSIFPEEIVLTAIFNKPEYKYLLYDNPELKKIQINERHINKIDAKNSGYYFYHQNYKKFM
jgi:hypothetical protein